MFSDGKRIEVVGSNPMELACIVHHCSIPLQTTKIFQKHHQTTLSFKEAYIYIYIESPEKIEDILNK